MSGIASWIMLRMLHASFTIARKGRKNEVCGESGTRERERMRGKSY
jgi:hypothetical protein